MATKVLTQDFDFTVTQTGSNRMKSLGLSVLVVFGLMCSSAFADEIYQLSVSENWVHR